VKRGFSVAYTAPDLATAQSVLQALSCGGEATTPLESTFWSPGFGMCVDRFGVPWMVDVETARPNG
jgi:PhnB protein